MTTTITMKGLAGVEHRNADGSFLAYLPQDPIPTPIKAGDRLRVRLEVADDTWIYAVSVIRQAAYTKLGAWAPDPHARGGVRTLWPGGRALTAEDATMMTLLVIASHDELPWLSGLVRTDCSMVVGKKRPDPPTATCDLLYGLFWKIPAQPRGMVPPTVGLLQDGGVRIPAIVAEHSGWPYTAIEWQFNPRK